jgi:molybdate transport system substrate-binding protein
MQSLRRLAVAAVTTCALLAWPATAGAAELKVLCSNGFRAVMEDLVPAFQHTTDHTVKVTYGLAAELARRIEGGEPFDLAILTPAVIDDLAGKGLIARSSSVTLARSPIALAIRRGAAKPDLGTLAAVRNTLLGARSIAYAREGASASFFLGLVERLELSAALAGKIVPVPSGAAVGAALSAGQVDFGVIPVSEILPVPGLDVGGTFPEDQAAFITMNAGISARASQPSASSALIEFLRAADAVPVLQKRGMQAP